MYFIDITLTNIFSYFGEKRFEFGSPTPDSNVVLLTGRKGQGKTSFLYALHLLFLSEQNEDLCRRAVGRLINPNRFLYGERNDNPSWWGVINRRARHDAQRNGTEARCSIAATIQSGGHEGEITLKRSWQFNSNGDDYDTKIEYNSSLRGTSRVSPFF